MTLKLHIRNRILLLVGGVLAFSAVVSALLIESHMRKLMREQFLASSAGEASSLAARAAEPILTDRVFEVQELVESFRVAHPTARYVFVLGAAGEVLASTFGPGVPRQLLSANRPHSNGSVRVQAIGTEEGIVHDLAASVLGGGGGMVRIGLAEVTLRRLTRHAERIVLLVQAIALIAALAITFVLAAVLVAPLRRLAVAANRVARGDLDCQVAIHTGDEIGELGAAFDHMVGDLRALRDELVASRDAATDVLRSLPEALLVVDPAGCVISVNPSTTRMSGFSEMEFVGRPLDVILDSVERGAPIATLLSQDSVTTSYDLRIRTSEGGAVPVSFRAAPIRGRDGSLTGFIISLRDLGQLRIAMERMRQERDDLEQRRVELERTANYQAHEVEQIRTHLVRSDRLVSIGQLASGVAHEINNPLASILTYARIIERELKEAGAPANERMAKALRVIQTEIGRCTRTVGRLLEYSRPSLPDQGVVHLDRVVGEVLDLAEPQARVARVEIEREIAAVRCRGDAEQIRQALLNVVLNAVQATPHAGPIRVTVRPALGAEGTPERRWVEVCVVDHGCGIPAENLPHIFDPFFSTKKVGEGTGLGLAIARDVIHLHRGDIEASSDLGRGCEIRIRLPVEQEDEHGEKSQATHSG